MGKIRVKTFGSPEEEEQEKKLLKQKKEARLQRAEHRDGGQAKKLTKAPGLKGGERVVSVGPSEEELAKAIEVEGKPEEKPSSAKASTDAKAIVDKSKGKKEKFAKKEKHQHSQNYLTNVSLVDKTKLYPLSDALKILSEFKKSKFDETVELHINTTIGGLSATLTLPHGTGKKVRVAIADEQLIDQIEAGKIDFDILVASPSIMSKLAKVAKILGPKGLMPNPKNGTITDKPQDLIKKYEAGQINIKTETKAPLIHLTVGKISFGEKKLTDNITSIIGAIKKENIAKVVLKSTMSPGIKLKL